MEEPTEGEGIGMNCAPKSVKIVCRDATVMLRVSKGPSKIALALFNKREL